MSKILKNSLFLIISFAIFTYTFIKSKHNLFHDYYLSYYVISLFFFVFGLIFFLLKGETKNKIILFFFSIIFSFYLIEGMITYNYFNKFSNKVEQSNFYDKRSPSEAYKAYKIKYNNLRYRIIPQQFWKNNSIDIMPLSTISNSLIFNCNENGYYTMWNSDLYGFNNPKSVWNDIDNEKILLLGDSFTAGECVNEEDNIAGNLRINFDKKVINLGVGGNGPLSNYAILKEYFHKTNSKHVFWFHYEGNDFEDLKKELDNKILKQYYLSDDFSQYIVNKQNEIDKFLINFLSNYEKKIANQSLNIDFDWGRFLKLYSLRELTIHSIFKKPHKIKKEFFEIILKSKKYVEKNDSKFYFVYLPQFHRYSSYYSFQNKENYEIIIKFLQSNDIEYIDINKKVFKNLKNPLDLFPFQSAGHYNEKGYNLVAKAIADFLK